MPSSSPPTRAQLTRILGLPANADDSTVEIRLDRLLGALRTRRDSAEGDARRGLDEEIARLETARTRLGATKPAPRTDRLPLVGALFGTLLMLLALFTCDDLRPDTEAEPRGTVRSTRARLEILDGAPGATLRVLDADRTEVLVETPAMNASVELSPGRYALEVMAQDCPQTWTRSVFFEPGATKRFAPSLCDGEGRIVIRANASDARVTIDGRDVDAAAEAPLPLAVGEHEVVVEKAGFRRFVSRVEIRRNETLELSADLLPEREERSRRFDFAFDTERLTQPDAPEPTPFDLGDLADSIKPAKTGRESTRLLQRDGLGGLPDGGSTAWHDRVSREFLARFDRDASGRIDSVGESESVTCVWWRETEESFDLGGLGLSMARYYGFDGTEWHPGALGFDRGVRGAAYARMRECGLQAKARSGPRTTS